MKKILFCRHFKYPTYMSLKLNVYKEVSRGGVLVKDGFPLVAVRLMWAHVQRLINK